jgi:hypothetical protein
MRGASDMAFTISRTYSVFNAPSGPYNEYLAAQAKARGLGFVIIPLKLGVFRSTYHITLQGDAEKIKRYMVEVFN